MRQDVFGDVSNGEIIFLGPAFLQADDLGRWGLRGDLVGDFLQAGVAVGGEEFEAPAVEGEEAEVCGEFEDIVSVLRGVRCRHLVWLF